MVQREKLGAFVSPCIEMGSIWGRCGAALTDLTDAVCLTSLDSTLVKSLRYDIQIQVTFIIRYV